MATLRSENRQANDVSSEIVGLFEKKFGLATLQSL